MQGLFFQQKNLGHITSSFEILLEPKLLLLLAPEKLGTRGLSMKLCSFFLRYTVSKLEIRQQEDNKSRNSGARAKSKHRLIVQTLKIKENV